MKIARATARPWHPEHRPKPLLPRRPLPRQPGVRSASHETPASHETYIGVQLLRGLAAMLVVVYHAGVFVRDWFPGVGDSFMLLSGAGGVDIFFPISGFVMLVSSRSLLNRPGGWKTFIERRLIRIVPLYWLATTLKVMLVLAVPALVQHTRLTAWHTVASYLFIFTKNAEGMTEPVLPVGWTLNYEMFFYAIFAFALFLRKPLLPIVISLLLLAVVLGRIIPITETPLAVLSPLILEFGAGLCIARLALTGWRFTPRTAAILFVVSLLALVGTSLLPSDMLERWRLLLWGVPGALLVFAGVSLEPWFARRKWDLARSLGDASYSIYLSHGFMLALLGIVAIKIGLHGITGAAVAFALAIVASGAFGLVVHRLVEQPITRYLLQRHKSSRTHAAIAAE